MKKLILLFLLITSIAYSQELRTAIKALDPSDFSGGKFIQESNGAFVPKTLAELRGYKVYTALLTQTDTNPPVATVLQNDLGTIVFTRLRAGVYSISKGTPFTTNKTYINFSINILAVTVTGTEHPHTVTTIYPNAYVDDDNFDGSYNIMIYTNGTDGYLGNTLIELRDYN